MFFLLILLLSIEIVLITFWRMQNTNSQIHARSLKTRLNDPMTTAKLVESFPQDLVFEILSRLPLKNLIQSQLVCKDWQTTMNNHYFRQVFMGRTAFIYHWYNTFDQSADPDPDPPKNPGHDSFRYRHGCDGLVLVTNVTKEKHIIWNPAIRRVLELPDPNKANSHGFAFSFVPATSSYKLVSFYEEPTGGALGCEVFTIGQSGNVWRCLSNFPEMTNRKRERVSVVTSGEAAHCVVVTKDGDGVINVEVVSLEMKTEEFSVNRVPLLDVGWKNYWDVDWDGKLAIVDVVGQNMEVMELEDYKKGRWSEKKKIIRLPFLKGNEEVFPLLAMKGEVWFWMKDDNIFRYMVETGKQTHVTPAKYVSYADRIYPYKPSLICFGGMVPDIKLDRVRPTALAQLQ